MNSLYIILSCLCFLETLVEVAPTPVENRSKQKPEQSMTHVAEIEECQEDIQAYCSDVAKRGNFQLFDCLRGGPNRPHNLTEPCENSLWKFQMELTKMDFFRDHLQKVCGASYDTLAPCKDPDLVREMGGPLYCLMENKEKVSDTKCHQLINDIGRFVFFDYATMKPFLTHCETDITALSCGRVGDPSTQDSVLECLSEKVTLLSPACHKQVLRVAELQAEDYHLDRSLYFACRESREVVCGNVKSGEGRVYKCLMDKKMDERIPQACRDQLTRRQQLRAEDYQTDYSMTKCRADIERFKCTSVNEKLSKSDAVELQQRLASIMICLENADKTQEKGLQADCKAELTDVKRQLAVDLSITPSILLHCSKPAAEHCKSVPDEEAFHCLLQLSLKTPDHPDSLLQTPCRNALLELLYLVDPMEDVFIDPVIAEACERTINTGVCRKTDNRGYSLYHCLLRLAALESDENEIDLVCQEKVLQMQTILSQEFELDDQLFRACHSDAVKLCYADENWHSRNSQGQLTSHGQGTFHCLYDKMRLYNDFMELQEAEKDLPDEDRSQPKDASPPPNLQPKCRQHMRAAIAVQSRRVDLNPMVYEACLPDLASYCKERPMEDGYRCLQENVEKLREKCKQEVITFSEDQNTDLSLDQHLTKACTPMVQKFCKHLLQEHKSAEDDAIMDCMVMNKMHPEMDPICRVGIEREQMLALKDFHISHELRLFCEADVKRYCPGKTTKTEVLDCLSEHLTWDGVNQGLGNDQPLRLKTKCRETLRKELLQRSETIELDPELGNACEADVKKLCSNVVDKAKVIECLQENQDQISKRCHKVLFKREQLMANDNRLDGPLITACQAMLEKHCMHVEEAEHILPCLQNALNEDPNFDRGCMKLVANRMELRGRDYRLDPETHRYCMNDIKKRCKSELDSISPQTDEEYRGRVTECLREQYAKHTQDTPLLSEDCWNHINWIVQQINLHSYMDPQLKAACAADLKEVCSREIQDTNGIDRDGRVTECLKHGLLQKKLKSNACATKVKALLDQSLADVHTDIVLYQACSNEIRFLCGDVRLGEGQLMCLLQYRDAHATNDNRVHMTKECLKALDLRVKMWTDTGRLGTLETFQQLAQHIQRSHAKFYLISGLLLFVLVVFIQGILCAKFAKRVPISWKNK